MVSTKTAAISIVIGLLIGFELNRIYVPENFESPLKYKFIGTSLRFVSTLGRLGSSFGLGHEAILLRNFIDTISNLATNTDPQVKTKDTTLNDVKVRIYQPKATKHGDKLPIMIYYHGGGYAFGSLSTYDYYLFEFVKKLNMVIVSVDYRMSPENAYPIPTNDCFDATKYILDNPSQFDADLNRLVIAGDSAGGDAVEVVIMRLIKEKLPLPKLQVLIYPWLQKFFNKLPSALRYEKTGITGISLSKFASWYLGVAETDERIHNIFQNNELFGLIEDDAERNRLVDYFDVRKIDAKYKKDVSYYETQSKYEIPTSLPETSILKQDSKMADLYRKLLTPELSPFIASDETLAVMPKTYMLVLEWDSLKDENLLYAERLRRAGVNVHVSFFENAYHAIAPMTQSVMGYQTARDIQQDLVNYLKENI